MTVTIVFPRGFPGGSVEGAATPVSSSGVALGLSRAEPSVFWGKLLADSPHPSRLGFEPQGLEDRLGV